MPPQAVFFDLYGTLLVYGDMAAAWSDWLDGLFHRLRSCGLALDPDEFAARCDGLFARPEPPVRSDGMTVYERRLSALCSEIGLGLTLPQVRDAVDASVHAWQKHVTLDAEAIPVLSTVRDSFPLALVSNFDHPPHVHRVLRETGLRDYLDTVVISGEVGFKKPDPRIFSIALERLGLRPDRVIYIGDAPEDVHGSTLAGLVPVRLDRNPGAETPQFDFRADPNGSQRRWSHAGTTIHSLGELLNLIPTISDGENP
ncbi:MAG: HAD family hydrolase [Acidobacteria bacterium]|nr:HAD family hydrolase [Acidobacteriota bacterium]